MEGYWRHLFKFRKSTTDCNDFFASFFSKIFFQRGIGINNIVNSFMKLSLCFFLVVFARYLIISSSVICGFSSEMLFFKMSKQKSEAKLPATDLQFVLKIFIPSSNKLIFNAKESIFNRFCKRSKLFLLSRKSCGCNFFSRCFLFKTK